MATRNQTGLFRKYRDALRNIRPESSTIERRGGSIALTEVFGGPKRYAALNTDDDFDSTRAGSVSVSLPPAWVDVSDDVSSEMQRLKIKMAHLAKSHGLALMVSFDDSTREQRTIERLTAGITSSLKTCEKKLQRLSGGPSVSGEENLRKNVQRFLATDLQTLSLEFRKLQKGYLAKLRLQNESQSGADLSMGFKRIDDDDDDGTGFSSTQINQLKENEGISAEREREITQIVESVNDMAQIMKDLAVLVIDQGTIVDRIDYNLTNVSVFVEQGVRQLTKAERHLRREPCYLMACCVMVLIALCALMLLVLVLKIIFIP